VAAPFQYEYHRTPIHHLNPLSKLLLFGTYLIFSGLYLDPWVKFPMILSLLLILGVARMPFRPYWGIMLIASFAVMVGQSYTAVLMVDPEYFKIYSREWVSRVILELTPSDFPIFGRAAITYGALLYLISFPLQVIPVILSVAGLLHTTSLSEIVSVLSRLRMPFPVIFMTTVALRFVPEIVDRLRLIQRAQSLRGWTLETRNPIKKITLLRPLLVPLTRSVIRSVDVISMSSKNRAFGLGPVTIMASFEMKKADYAVCLTTIILTILGIYAAFAWNFGAL
jgi:energy-coupling factor transporter transmembrane protein EcfT